MSACVSNTFYYSIIHKKIPVFSASSSLLCCGIMFITEWRNDMKKALIIINRTAGMGQKAELEAALVRTLESQNFDAVIKYTEADDFEHIVLEQRETADLF